ncbi:hypothetical protein HYW43_03880 [Candidatus Daviesbacteria bacterium]|nr:hypothetical protein [Candidatus Daviesbacteria bacterium]
MKIGKDKLILLSILLAGFTLRVLVSPYYNHTSDIGLWIYWASEIDRIGFRNFFDIISWTDYLPFYFYILFIIQKLIQLFAITDPLIFKMPAILADIGTAYLIYLLAKRWQFNYRLVLPAIYLFNPAIFGNSAMWGQVDGLGAFLVTFCLYLFLRQQLILLGIVMSMAILFKPLYLLLLPIFLTAQLKYNHPNISLRLTFLYKIFESKNFKKLLLIIFSPATSAFILVIPFAKNVFSVPALILERFSSSLGQYQYASVNAFNFWAMLGKNFQSDQETFLNINYHNWGLIIFASIFGSTLILFLFRKITTFLKYQHFLTLGLAISFFSIFIFATRVHERHLLTVFPFLTLLCLQSRVFASIYIFTSALYVTNLFFGILYLYNGGFPFPNSEVVLYSGMLFLTCLVLIFNSFLNFRDEKIN